MFAVVCPTCVDTSFWRIVTYLCVSFCLERSVGEQWLFFIIKQIINKEPHIPQLHPKYTDCVQTAIWAHVHETHPLDVRKRGVFPFPHRSLLKLKLGLLTACPSLTRTPILSPITNLPKCSCLSQRRQTPEGSVDLAFGFQTESFSCLLWGGGLSLAAFLYCSLGFMSS